MGLQEAQSNSQLLATQYRKQQVDGGFPLLRLDIASAVGRGQDCIQAGMEYEKIVKYVQKFDDAKVLAIAGGTR